MAKYADLTNHRRGLLVAICAVGVQNGARRWLCECDCGSFCFKNTREFNRAKFCSCGCWGKSIKVAICASKIKHGMAQSRLHSIWCDMKDRCFNPLNKSYHYYGGRGIKITPPWHNFINFKNWAMINGYFDHLSIVRIDVNVGYSPSNCKWIKMSEQCKNTTRTHRVVFNGVETCLKDSAVKLNINYFTLHDSYTFTNHKIK